MRNDLLLEHPVNKTFEEVLWMTTEQFREWCIELRKVVVDLWDNHGLPPRVGFTEKETVEQFKKMLNFPVHEFEQVDLLTGEKNVIRNTSVIGNAVNDWFPTMMKTRITYSTKEKARSIYDYFSREELLETFITYATRHFKRDSFYHYSSPISVGDEIKIGSFRHKVTTAEEFISWFEGNSNILRKFGWDYWLCGVKADKKYTGYTPSLKEKNNLIIQLNDLLIPKIPVKSLENVDWDRWDTYTIRLYQYGQKLFPSGLKAFRISFCQYAVNFPPLTAKYLYEKYLPKSKELLHIYDPSMGWGGRLLGAMSIRSDRKIKYIGTDPNEDHHWETYLGMDSRYNQIANFFNGTARQGTLFPFKQQYECYYLGSEVIGENEYFQDFKGKFDLVFTSPPYFAKEIYSDDATQSCNKFDAYQEWKEGFLVPTLRTAVEYLRSDRYLLWNISDALFDGEMLPLEKDSREILESLGMKYVETLKMALAQMPGGNRFVETGESEEVERNTVFGLETKTVQKVVGKMKNYCKIKSNGKEILLKYEPIFVFKKD